MFTFSSSALLVLVLLFAILNFKPDSIGFRVGSNALTETGSTGRSENASEEVQSELSFKTVTIENLANVK